MGSKAVCPQLMHLIGSMEEWHTLITSCCRTGVEFSNAWNDLQNEAMTMCNFLDTGLEAPLSVPVEGGEKGLKMGAPENLLWNRGKLCVAQF